MASSHQFGGRWTEDKLECIRKYLNAYLTIFNGNVRASTFTTTFVDAFAGTGYRNTPIATKRLNGSLFPEDIVLDDDDAKELRKGSAQIALELTPPFDRYKFVAENPLPLCNRKNVPIYLLCFAAVNPKAASTTRV